MLNAASIPLALGVAPIVAQPPGTTAVSGWSPSAMLAGWASDGSTVSFPIASVSGLTPALADPITGDAREVVWRLASHFFGWYNGQVVAGAAPQALTAKLSPGSFKTSAPFNGRQKMDLTFTAYVGFPAMGVADEPEAES